MEKKILVLCDSCSAGTANAIVQKTTISKKTAKTVDM